jgi:uncharacterized protein
MSDAPSNTSQTTTAEEATPQQVADYLINHPNFFDTNHRLLTALNFKHQSGQSVSLIERQVAALRQEKKQLKQQLDTFVGNAKKNDLLLEKTKILILALVRCSDNNEIQSTIENRLLEEFASSACKLWLFTEDARTNGLSLQQANTELTRFTQKKHAFCGLLGEQEKSLLFADQASHAGSAAVLPLHNNGTLIALLAIGNADESYYRENMSTTLLDYIGHITAELLSRES